MKKFLCQTCESPLKIKEGDFIFSFDINCDNEHKLKNIDLDDLLSMRKIYNNINLFQCKKHKKRNMMHCFDCEEDICFLCYKELHKSHKIEYIKNLDLSYHEKFSIKNYLDIEKRTIDTFLNELFNFQNKLNLYIKILAKGIIQYHKLRTELFNDLSEKNISYIDINNNKQFRNHKYLVKMIDFSNEFINCETFLKKYDFLKDMIELLVKKGEFLKEKKIKKNYNTYKNNKIFPINNKYFINLNESNIEIAKNISNINSEIFDYKIIFRKYINFKDYKIVLKENDNIENKFSFYILNYITKIEYVNGFNMSDDTVEEYPFTNGAFYVNRRIDMYVRRQDPHNIYKLYDEVDIEGNKTDFSTEDNYIKEAEIKC